MTVGKNRSPAQIINHLPKAEVPGCRRWTGSLSLGLTDMGNDLMQVMCAFNVMGR